MSVAYRANWVTVSSRITGGDNLDMDLALLGILPAGDMTALLRDELKREGWKEGDGGELRGTVSGNPVTLAPDGQTVRVRVEATREVRAQGVDGTAAESALEAAAVSERAELVTRSAQALTAAEPDLRASLGRVIQRVYLEALKRKAASLGTVESVREISDGSGGYEVVLEVKV